MNSLLSLTTTSKSFILNFCSSDGLVIDEIEIENFIDNHYWKKKSLDDDAYIRALKDLDQ